MSHSRLLATLVAAFQVQTPRVYRRILIIYSSIRINPRKALFRVLIIITRVLIRVVQDEATSGYNEPRWGRSDRPHDKKIKTWDLVPESRA